MWGSWKVGERYLYIKRGERDGEIFLKKKKRERWGKVEEGGLKLG